MLYKAMIDLVSHWKKTSEELVPWYLDLDIKIY